MGNLYFDQGSIAIFIIILHLEIKLFIYLELYSVRKVIKNSHLWSAALMCCEQSLVIMVLIYRWNSHLTTQESTAKS